MTTIPAACEHRRLAQVGNTSVYRCVHCKQFERTIKTVDFANHDFDKYRQWRNRYWIAQAQAELAKLRVKPLRGP